MDGRNDDEKASSGDEASVAAMSSAPRLSLSTTLRPLLAGWSSSRCRCFLVLRSYLRPAVEGVVVAPVPAAAVALLFVALRFLPPAGFWATEGDDELSSLRPPADLDRLLPLERTSTSDDVRGIGGDLAARPAETSESGGGRDDKTGEVGVERDEDDEAGVDAKRKLVSLPPRVAGRTSSSSSSLRRL
jgi:hypothetical protein